MRLTLIFLLIGHSLTAQVISAAQQKALNAHVDYANQSADEVAAVVHSLKEYYPAIHRKSSWGPPRYTCPVQPDEYYFNTALTQGKLLPSSVSAAVTTALQELRSAAESIDVKCKALDTYHKLEDFKQDNFARAGQLIQEIRALLPAYKKKQDAFQAALTIAYKKLGNGGGTEAYRKADAAMRQSIMAEREFIDLWTFNLNEQVHTGWPADKLEESIQATSDRVSALKSMTPAMKYPASSMWPSFQSSLASILDTKRRGLDEYNFEAKKSDAHSNSVYLELINYYNGTLVADYNTFIQFADRDGYHGLKAIKYFPMYEVRTDAATIHVNAATFRDIPRVSPPVTPQKAAIAKPVYDALETYVDYINETWRQTRYMQLVLNSFSGSASYYKTLESFEKRGGMNFDFKDYQLPLSHYQKAVAASKSLPPAISKPLNDQAEVLLNILKELNDQAAVLEVEVKERRYEKDRLKKVYEILERQAALLDIWDERKELFYQDIRRVFDACPPATPSNSWYVSGKALRDLADLDREALFKAKEYYKGKGDGRIETSAIDQMLRDVIAKEYDNMKGIEKIGRNNGLCPYTPYEDLPETSKSLSEALKKLKPPKGSAGMYEHPYHSVVYLYNEIVDDYNKFSELSTAVHHLKTVKQPEFFQVKYPDLKPQQQALPASAASSDKPLIAETPATKPAEKPSETKNDPVTMQSQLPQRQTTLVRDTVYIEKRDTVYISEAVEDLRSMEGYATNNMVLLLDVSGSMNAPDKLPILKKSVLSMLSMMRAEDKVSIIAFSSKPRAVLESVSFREEERIRTAIENLKSSGKTDGNAGLKLAYKVADGNYIRGGNNRIVLATDGEFGLSDETRQLIERFSKEDIFLTIFNFGKGAGASKNLEHLATLGKGNYEYISRENVDFKLIREVKSKRKK